jgi:hypothetical protein
MAAALFTSLLLIIIKDIKTLYCGYEQMLIMMFFPTDWQTPRVG